MYAPGKLCPFMTSGGDDGPIFQPCVEDSCMFWNKNNPDGIMTSADMDTTSGECALNLLSQSNAANLFTAAHMHISHFHGRKHNASNEHILPAIGIENSLEGTSQSNMPTSVPPTTVLIQEFLNNRDEDGNGLIYGYDFYIHNEDGQRPPTLASLETHSAWKHPVDNMSWAEYLASMEEQT